MGKKDIALARFFEDEERYADLINAFVFKGRQVVRRWISRRGIPAPPGC